MISLGRITSAIAVLGTIVLYATLLTWPELGQPAESGVRLVNIIGSAVVISMPVGWVMGILHWGSNSALGERKRTWGLIVILGFILGATLYFYHPRGASRDSA